MNSFYNKEAGVVLHSFSESDFALLKKHKDTKKLKLWFEGTSIPNLDFLLECPHVENMNIYGGKIGDYSALTHLPKLQHLFLNGRLRKWTENLAFINDIHSLNSLGIYNFPMLVQFPYLGDCTSLEHVNIGGCKRLTDIANVSSIANLKSFGIVSTPISVEDLDFIASKAGMEKMRGAFGSKKKDDMFQSMLDKYGLTYG